MKLWILPAVALASCASSKPATQPQAQAQPEPVVGPPQVAWKDMTKPQRGKYMRAVVLPKMKEVFVSFDPKTFAELNCKTCHGPGAEDGSFHMPNPSIFVLPKDFGPLAKEKPEWLKFMATQVKPKMAELLGVPEFDPRDPQPGAFGCHACHTLEGEAATRPSGS